jgi:hypothetical protein
MELTMKKLVIVLALSLSALACSSQEIKFSDVKKPVKCADNKQLFTGLLNVFGETITWSSSNAILDDRTTIALFKNKQNGSWTLVEYDDTIACVLASGEDAAQ